MRSVKEWRSFSDVGFGLLLVGSFGSNPSRLSKDNTWWVKLSYTARKTGNRDNSGLRKSIVGQMSLPKKHTQLSSFAELCSYLIKSLTDANPPESVNTYSLPTGYLPLELDTIPFENSTGVIPESSRLNTPCSWIRDDT